MYDLYLNPVKLIIPLILLAIWDLIWRGIALWHTAKNKQKGWFICLLIFNTIGILPIIYLLGFKPKTAEEPEQPLGEVETITTSTKKASQKKGKK
jgi:hypothetical protein